MKTRMYTITIGQGWRHSLQGALACILADGCIEEQGYTDASSTTWTVLVRSSLTARKMETLLRRALRFDGWLLVKGAK